MDRVNRAIDFILQNLDKPLRLEVVARAACFSPFHFHRVFRSLVGESLNEFVKRVRLERALLLMSQRDWKRTTTKRRQQRPQRPSLTDIAFACGFASSSDFVRCFKTRYGAPPSRFDLAAFRTQRREEWQSTISDPAHRHRLDRLKPGANPDGFAVRLQRLPPRSVAYLRVPDSFREGVVQRAIERMVRWAERRGLADGQWLGYMWDNPEITAPAHCRYDVGLVLPDEVVLPRDGEIGRLEFPAMQVAEIEIRGGIELELRALDWLFGTWLPTSGFVPAEQPNFEAWIGRPFAHGTEYFEILAQLPVVKG